MLHFYHDLGSNLLVKFKSDAIVKVIYHGPSCLFMYLLFGLVVVAFCSVKLKLNMPVISIKVIL